MDGGEGFRQVFGEGGDGDEVFLVRGLVAALETDFSAGEVAGADFEADGDSFFDPVPFFDASAEVPVVDLDADFFTGVGFFAEGGGELLAGVEDGLFGFLFRSDGDDDDVLRGDPGGEDESVIIGVGHDEGSDEAGGDAPRGGVSEFRGAFAAGEADVLGFGKVLAEVVGGSRLDCFSVLDHGFDS